MICTTLALLIGLYTVHPDTDGLNENNKVIGVQCDNLVFVTYDNSYNRRSNFGGYAFRFKKDNPLNAGVIVGAVSGYPSDILEHDPSPAIIPYVRWGPIQVNGYWEVLHVGLVLEW